MSKQILSAVGAVNNEYGAGSARMLNDTSVEKVAVIPTGMSVLDNCIGAGGVPVGKLTEILGKEASGKSSLCLSIAAQANERGIYCAYIDAEHSLNVDWAKKLGIKPEMVSLSQPQSAEQALDIVQVMSESGVGLIIVDSVAALVPSREVDEEFGASHMGLHARLMSQAMRKLVPVISRNKTTLVFVNQLRATMGAGWGSSPDVGTGGSALRYYASLRIQLRVKAAIKEGGDKVGRVHEAEIIKNKLAVPYKKMEFQIGDSGLDDTRSMLKAVMEKGVVKSGAWYKYKEWKAQGEQGFLELLKSDEQLRKELGI